MSIINEYNFFLDSKYRSKGSNPSPEFILKSPILLSNPNHRFVAKIKSVDIPYSFKSLSAPFNTLRINYNEAGHANSTTTLTIPEGNYSISVLLDTLKQLILNFITPIAQHVPDLNFTYDRNTGRCTLLANRVSGNNATYITLYWSDVNVDFLAEFFGFTGNNNSVIGYTAGHVLNNTNNISEINVNCSPVSSIYIRSGSLSQPNNNEEFLTEYDESISDILLKVPVSSPYGTWLIYYNADDEVNLSNNIIDNIQLYITHLSYDPISLQGVHWRCHLYIKEVRPAYLDELENIARENEAKIKDIEDMKKELLGELDNLTTEIKDKLPIDENNKIEELKKSLISEVEQRREQNLN